MGSGSRQQEVERIRKRLSVALAVFGLAGVIEFFGPFSGGAPSAGATLLRSLVLLLTGAAGGALAALEIFSRIALQPAARLLEVSNRLPGEAATLHLDAEEAGIFHDLADGLAQRAQRFNEFVHGVGDVTHRLHEISAAVSAAMEEILGGSETQSELVEETASLLSSVNHSIRSIDTEIDDLTQSTELTASAVVEMGSSVEEVSRNMSALNDAVENASSSSQEMGASIREVAESADEVQRMAEETAASMAEMDRAIHEVNDHVSQASDLTRSVSQGAEEGAVAVAATIEGIEDIRNLTREAKDVLVSLVTRIDEIAKILNVMGEINQETSLLSLNAAIIAAQAGEQGKAFAVVANHVKTLAQRTATGTHEIEEKIAAVQQASSNAMAAMAAGIEAVEAGVARSRHAGESLATIQRLAAEANSRVSEITRSAAEQTRNSRHVTDAADRTSAMVQKISTAMTEQTDASDQTMKISESAIAVCHHVLRSTSEQRRTGQFITESVTQINEKMRAMRESLTSHGNSTTLVSQSVMQILDVARKTSERVPELMSSLDTLHRDARALEAEIERFREAR